MQVRISVICVVDNMIFGVFALAVHPPRDLAAKRIAGGEVVLSRSGGPHAEVQVHTVGTRSGRG